ncbi:MAG: TetR/AcrR family transcriptional regulator [Clostridia bacterium]|nr:TetR/AcrR family transcriptional regulator [Clostridia bacterium]
MKSEVRQPRQSRSIEKKNKIILAGYELFSEVGYYGTNTAEIAKRAGVSTGIVYGYFQDKRDILICVLEIYIDKVLEPIYKILDKLLGPIAFDTLIPKMVDEVLKIHKKNTKIHEALHSLASTDEAVNAKFIQLEDRITQEIINKFCALGVQIENAQEKIHLAMNILQAFSHEYIFDKHEYIDYIVLRDMVSQTIINLFK